MLKMFKGREEGQRTSGSVRVEDGALGRADSDGLRVALDRLAVVLLGEGGVTSRLEVGRKRGSLGDRHGLDVFGRQGGGKVWRGPNPRAGEVMKKIDSDRQSRDGKRESKT